ncbi:MAG: CBS domain-containing protein [Gammaproteobacteria bacterium]|nr:CBS domain-containing protein [Pseudomonadales bacterium]MCP5347438.1 CBS domain-containing protein [Pseudomonadales bacterium]
MKNLHLYSTLEVDELAWPERPVSYTLDSPARDFISDFRLSRPMVFDSATSADDLKAFMLNAHIQVTPVVDSQSHFIGIVGLSELTEQALMRKLSEGYHRSDIRVGDVMIRRRDLPAFDSVEIDTASIGDVIAAIREHGCRYALVVDRPTHRIRGIYSVEELSSILKAPIEIRDQSSFYRVFAPVSLANQRRARSWD